MGVTEIHVLEPGDVIGAKARYGRPAEREWSKSSLIFGEITAAQSIFCREDLVDLGASLIAVELVRRRC
ncbi:MAG: hypothetical protein ACRD5Z_01100, partial [Bryobacteraceae bacterium]